MDNKNMPINKGNYCSFETQEREKLFEKYKAEGWERQYKQYRKNWRRFPKKEIVSDYPLLVDLELSSICNLNCPMCYTITDEFKKRVKATLMDYNLFTKIVDELSGNVPAIRLSLRGEPTLHPRFIECIKYAKNRGIREISFLTNGSRLDSESFVKIMDAGATWITISIDGLADKYEAIRKPLIFEETLQKIKSIKKIKEKKNSLKPVIKIQSLWPAIRNNPSMFYKTFVPFVDLIAFNPLIDYLQKDEDIVFIESFSCPQLYQRLVVGADGQVMMCSNDEESSHVIGDANRETIYEIWHGKNLNKVRKLHQVKNGFKQISACKRCYLPRETEITEIAEVDGRKFGILNYVNRAQRIGE